MGVKNITDMRYGKYIGGDGGKEGGLSAWHGNIQRANSGGLTGGRSSHTNQTAPL